jgi:hypothetical protein
VAREARRAFCRFHTNRSDVFELREGVDVVDFQYLVAYSLIKQENKYWRGGCGVRDAEVKL